MYRKLEHQSTIQSQTAIESEYQINLIAPNSPESINQNQRLDQPHNYNKLDYLKALTHTPQQRFQRPKTAMDGNQSAVQLNRTHNARGNTLLTPNLADKKMVASRVINQTRIKLRDYLFMANTSSDLAASSKRETLQESKRTVVQSELGNSRQNHKSQATHSSSFSAPQSPALQSSQVKSQYKKQKYCISNSQMAAVLRKEIVEELNILRSSIQIVQNGLQSRDNISSEELLELYALRGNLQRYNTQFAESTTRFSWMDMPEAFKKMRERKNSQIFELTQI